MIDETAIRDVLLILDDVRSLDLEIEVLVLLCERELDEIREAA